MKWLGKRYCDYCRKEVKETKESIQEGATHFCDIRCKKAYKEKKHAKPENKSPH